MMITNLSKLPTKTKKPAVLISLEDFQGDEETAYLMASPKNAERLNQAIAQIETGIITEHALLDE